MISFTILEIRSPEIKKQKLLLLNTDLDLPVELEETEETSAKERKGKEENENTLKMRKQGRCVGVVLGFVFKML